MDIFIQGVTTKATLSGDTTRPHSFPVTDSVRRAAASNLLPEKYKSLDTSSIVLIIHRTKCNKCHRLKLLAAFSNKQRDELRSGLASGKIKSTDHAKSEWIRCIECTSGSRNELQCNICGLTKALDSFSKQQRKQGDDAVSSWLARTWLRLITSQRCMTCVTAQDHVSAAPTSDEVRHFIQYSDDEDISGDEGSDSDTNSIITNEFVSCNNILPVQGINDPPRRNPKFLGRRYQA